MMRQIIFTFALMLLGAGCGNNNSPTEPDPFEVVRETISPSLEREQGVAYVVQKNLDLGRLKQENVTILKSNPPQYVVKGPRVLVEKLKRLASGEWLYVELQPKTAAARDALKLHIHKFTCLQEEGLMEEDVKELVPGVSWMVIGPKEIVERLQKVADPE